MCFNILTMGIRQAIICILISLTGIGCSSEDNPSTEPAQYPQITTPQNTQPERFVSLTGGVTTVGIKENGTLWAWGKNVSGQMGNGQTADYFYSFLPSQIGTDTNWKTVEYSGSSVIGIKTDGSLWRWGTVFNLETNHNEFIASPTRIGNDSDWKMVVGTSGYYVGIKENGTLWGWGYDSNIGLGRTESYHLNPTLLNDGNWKEVAGGANHSIALKADGTIWTMGNNNEGELGNGMLNVSTYTLSQVGTAADWSHVYAGTASCLAIKTNGTLWAWGRNTYGQLGLGSISQTLAPTQVGNASDWRMASISGSDTIFLKNDGTVWGCGLFMKKLVGTALNSVTETYSPVKLDNRTDWDGVLAIAGTVYARKSNFDYWGVGYSYALGLSTSDFFNLQMTPMAWN